MPINTQFVKTVLIKSTVKIQKKNGQTTEKHFVKKKKYKLTAHSKTYVQYH